MSKALQDKCISALVTKNVEILWNDAVAIRNNSRVPIKCLKHNSITVRSVYDLARGKYDCWHCATDRQSTVANYKNLTLLSRTSSTALVRCNICTHESTVRLSSLLGSNNVDCEGCRVEKYKSNCEKFNITYNSVFRKNGIVYVNGTCNGCLTTTDYVYSRLSNGKRYVFCNTCSGARHHEAAKQKYFTVLDNNIASSIEIQCKNGHSMSINSSILLGKSNIICKECRTDKYKKALMEKGCTFLRFVNQKVVEFIGTEGEILQSQTVLSGKFATKSGNRWKQKTSVYLILNKYNEQIFIKIGTAINPDKRRKELKIAGEATLKILATFETRYEADKLEKFIHKNLDGMRLDQLIASNFLGRIINRKRNGIISPALDGKTEWFDLQDTSLVDKLVKDYLNGINTSSTD